MKNILKINTTSGKYKINKNIYGHFAEHLGRCIYDGFWVGENPDIPNTQGIRNDVIKALKDIKIPVLRWPGGCFADEYHWKDGMGAKEKRPKMINTHWGGMVESNISAPTSSSTFVTFWKQNLTFAAMSAAGQSTRCR